jgi:hypothetical protein
MIDLELKEPEIKDVQIEHHWDLASLFSPKYYLYTKKKEKH